MKTKEILNKKELIEVLRQNHIIYAALFGSRAKGTDNLKDQELI